MRILHTADWHLGRTLEGRSRSREQEEFADEICNVVSEERANLVVIAGDVFDNSNPPAHAEDLFYGTVDRLADGGRRLVLVLAGNHDSPDRLCAARPLAGRHGIALVGFPNEMIESASAPNRADFTPVEPGVCVARVPGCEHESLVIALPYPSEARLRQTEDHGERTEADLRKAYIGRLRGIMSRYSCHIDQERPTIIASHLLLMGGQESESERPLTVGGAYSVPPEVFDCGAHYVALGHLHRPQSVSCGTSAARYAGSPLGYSFSETGHAKSVSVVDVNPGCPAASVREVLLNSGKPMVKWVAPLGMSQVSEWCGSAKDQNAWIDLEIHLQQAMTHEDISQLRKMHQGFVHIRPVYPEMQEIAREARASIPLPELFRQFYIRRRGAEPQEALIDLFLQMVQHEPEVPSR